MIDAVLAFVYGLAAAVAIWELETRLRALCAWLRAWLTPPTPTPYARFDTQSDDEPLHSTIRTRRPDCGHTTQGD